MCNMQTLKFVSTILLIICLGLSFIGLCLRLKFGENPYSINEFIRNLYLRNKEQFPEQLILSPLESLNGFLDYIFGFNYVSRRLIKAIALVTVPIMISSFLLLAIIQSGEQNAKLYPWKFYSGSLEFLHDYLGEAETSSVNDEDNIVAKILSERSQSLSSYNTPSWQIIYTVVYFLLFSLTTIILTLISVGITRKFAREMVHAKGTLTLLGGVLLNLALIIIVTMLAITLITIISSPAFWILYDLPSELAKLRIGFVYYSIFFLVFFLLVFAIGWFLILSGWIKIIVAISLIPWVCLTLLLLFQSLIYSQSGRIYNLFTRFLESSLESSLGAFSYILGCLGALTTLLTAICLVLDFF